MGAPASGKRSRSSRRVKAGLWLAPAVVAWAILAAVARIPSARAGATADALFVITLLVTSVAGAGAAIQASARPRQAALRAAALTLGALLAVALLEIAAAARLVHWEMLFNSLRGESQLFVADPDLGFRNAPGVRRSGRLRSDIEKAWGLPASRSDRVTFSYDRLGYRNPTERTWADLVLIGDSYVEGAYASDDEIAARFLEDDLGRPVTNLGVAGYGTAQELLVLKADALPLAPRVVIWFFFEGNDLYNDQGFENAMLAPRKVRASGWTESHGWWRRSLLRNGPAELRLVLSPLVPTYYPDHGTVATGPHRGTKILFGPEAAVPWGEFERGRWERTQATFMEGARLVREHDAALLLVYVPTKFRVYREFLELSPDGAVHRWSLWPLPTLFAHFCHAQGLACLDLTGPLADSVRAGGMPHAPTDSHWSPEGHRLVARLLKETLASLGWIPLAERPRSRTPGAAGTPVNRSAQERP
jgi:hypothetical protein